VGGSALQIGDVCSTCNNEVLSELDQYFCGLYDSCIAGHTFEAGEKIDFDYDYNYLLRWLLKMLYNNARARTAEEEHVKRLRQYAEFVIEGESTPSNVLLLVRVTVPYEENEGKITPSHMACGLIDLDEFDYRIGETYLVSIDSFDFILAVLCGSSFREKALESLSQDPSLGTVSRLNPGDDSTRLTASETTALHVDGQLVMEDWEKWNRRAS
jgi:hypothetical protein